MAAITQNRQVPLRILVEQVLVSARPVMDLEACRRVTQPAGPAVQLEGFDLFYFPVIGMQIGFVVRRRPPPRQEAQHHVSREAAGEGVGGRASRGSGHGCPCQFANSPTAPSK